MAKENSRVVRVPKKIFEDLEKALDIRYKNNLISRKDMKATEGFRLIGRTEEWERALDRLKFQPKKEDVRKK